MRLDPVRFRYRLQRNRPREVSLRGSVSCKSSSGWDPLGSSSNSVFQYPVFKVPRLVSEGVPRQAARMYITLIPRTAQAPFSRSTIPSQTGQRPRRGEPRKDPGSVSLYIGGKGAPRVGRGSGSVSLHADSEGTSRAEPSILPLSRRAGPSIPSPRPRHDGAQAGSSAPLLSMEEGDMRDGPWRMLLRNAYI